MTRWLALLAAAVCALVALVVLPRLWRSEPPPLERSARQGGAGAGAGPAGYHAGGADGGSRSRPPPRSGADVPDAAADRAGARDQPQAADHAPAAMLAQHVPSHGARTAPWIRGGALR